MGVVLKRPNPDYPSPGMSSHLLFSFLLLRAWYGRLDLWLRCGFRVPDRLIPNHPFPTPGSPFRPWQSIHDCLLSGMLGRFVTSDCQGVITCTS